MAVELRGRFNLLDNFSRRVLLRHALRPQLGEPRIEHREVCIFLASCSNQEKTENSPAQSQLFTAEKRSRQDALQTTSSARLDIFYLQNFS